MTLADKAATNKKANDGALSMTSALAASGAQAMTAAANRFISVA
jgi:hypothetical protein